jgi:hypothetical protein
LSILCGFAATNILLAAVRSWAEDFVLFALPKALGSRHCTVTVNHVCVSDVHEVEPAEAGQPIVANEIRIAVLALQFEVPVIRFWQRIDNLPYDKESETHSSGGRGDCGPFWKAFPCELSCNSGIARP